MHIIKMLGLYYDDDNIISSVTLMILTVLSKYYVASFYYISLIWYVNVTNIFKISNVFFKYI